jgi:membrane-bound lytic murein transglycosylase A
MNGYLSAMSAAKIPTGKSSKRNLIMLAGLLAFLRFRCSRTSNVRCAPVLEKPRIRLNLMRLSWLISLFFLCSCALLKEPDHFGARAVAFADLPDWQNDDQAEALSAFLSSCDVLSKTPKPQSPGSNLQISAALWQSLCADAAQSPYAPREFFERRFTPYRVNNNGFEEGLFTGYYEPVLYGAYHRYGDFQYPLYMAPPDLTEGGQYYTHAEINNGKLNGKKLEVVWVDDPVMRFFLQIQGSGRVKLTNGKTLQVGFAGKNGQPYVSIGKIMGDEGLLPKDQINFFTIRQWMYQHPDRAFALMERNPSYVFFKVVDRPSAVGAVDAVLTPARSLAVDSTYIPYGLPVYLETELPPEPERDPTPFKHLMVAQDTGGAIKGPVRADIFFGTGDEAEYMAGYMARKGVYTLLVPKEIAGQITK